jgi:asparagine synthase (glutamine-hydrolysing)
MTESTLVNLAGRLEPEVADLLGRLRAIADAGGPVLHRLRTLDAMSYMPGAVLAKVDRMSMQFALEVRCPLLDKRLAEWAQTLPASCLHDGKTPKILLKWLALQYLPKSIVYRRKQGFGVPDQCWSQGRLLDLAESLLTGPGARLTAYLDLGRLREHLRQQRSPAHFHVYQIWELLVLEQWLRMATTASARLAA